MSRRLARGLSFHVQEVGAGPPVVMLHGLLLGSIATWYFTAAPALAQFRRVLMFDLRGHGLSERPASGYGTAEMVADLHALTADEPTPFALVGHSYGAVVALRFALAYPERVERLALVEGPLPPSELMPIVRLSPNELFEALPQGVRDAVVRGGRQAKRLVESVGALLRDTTLPRDVAAEEDVSETDLAQLTCPVLCVYGSQSPCLPAGKRVAEASKQGRLLVLDGGHFLHIDAAAELTEALGAFLRA